MSKNLWVLVKVQLKLALRGFRVRMGSNGRSKWGLLLLPLLALSFVPLLIMITTMYSAVFFTLKGTGQGHLVLVIALTAGQLASLMFGVFYVISSFYFAKDLNLLIPLPIHPRDILLSKFISILLGEYLTMAPLVLPAFFVYGLFAQVSWLYLPFGLIIYLLLPVIPLVLASLFSLVLMRVTNLRRNRDMFRVAGALVGVGIAIGFQFFGRFSARSGMGTDPAAVQQYLAARQGLVQSIGRYFPTSVWGADALRTGAPAMGAGSFLIYVCVAALALVVLAWVSEKIFFGGLVGGEEVRASGKVLSRDDLAKATANVQTPLWALLRREIKLLNRTPTFLMAAVLPMIMMPVFMAIPMIQQQGDLPHLLAKMATVRNSPLVTVGAIGVLLFFNSLSSLPATAISREGRHFWISRSLPVPPRIQVHAKVLHSMIFSLLNLAVVIGALAFFRILTLPTLLYTIVGGMAASAATGYSSILVDLIHPHLTWTDPQQAMKGNLNTLFAMILVVVLGGIFGGVAVLLHSFLPALLQPGIVLLFLLEAYGLFRASAAVADRRYVVYED